MSNLRIGFALQAFVEQKRPKRNHRNRERQNHARQLPLLNECNSQHGKNINHEQSAVKRTDDANWRWLVETIFERHGDEHQQYKGDAFGKSEKSQPRFSERNHGNEFVARLCAAPFVILIAAKSGIKIRADRCINNKAVSRTRVKPTKNERFYDSQRKSLHFLWKLNCESAI